MSWVSATFPEAMGRHLVIMLASTPKRGDTVMDIWSFALTTSEDKYFYMNCTLLELCKILPVEEIFCNSPLEVWMVELDITCKKVHTKGSCRHCWWRNCRSFYWREGLSVLYTHEQALSVTINIHHVYRLHFSCCHALQRQTVNSTSMLSAPNKRQYWWMISTVKSKVNLRLNWRRIGTLTTKYVASTWYPFNIPAQIVTLIY